MSFQTRTLTSPRLLFIVLNIPGKTNAFSNQIKRLYYDISCSTMISSLEGSMAPGVPASFEQDTEQNTTLSCTNCFYRFLENVHSFCTLTELGRKFTFNTSLYLQVHTGCGGPRPCAWTLTSSKLVTTNYRLRCALGHHRTFRPTFAEFPLAYCARWLAAAVPVCLRMRDRAL